MSSTSSPASSLKGRSVLITGAASGIGLACATRLAQAGALVTLADVNEEAGQAAARQLSRQGLQAHFVTCDVTSYSAQVNMFHEAIRFGGGRIDLVIPNAGVLGEKNLFDMVEEEEEEEEEPAVDAVVVVQRSAPPEPSFSGVRVNLQAVYYTCFLALHFFRFLPTTAPSFAPSIVLMSSMAGYVGFPSSTTYSLSKFGVRGLFYSLRDRAARAAVRINLVAPCFVDTQLTRQKAFVDSEAGFMAHVMGFLPMHRVVNAVMRFCTDESLHGRAVGIFPAGAGAGDENDDEEELDFGEDLGDDLHGGHAGPVLAKRFAPIAQRILHAAAGQTTLALDI